MEEEAEPVLGRARANDLVERLWSIEDAVNVASLVEATVKTN